MEFKIGVGTFWMRNGLSILGIFNNSNCEKSDATVGLADNDNQERSSCKKSKNNANGIEDFKSSHREQIHLQPFIRSESWHFQNSNCNRSL